MLVFSLMPRMRPVRGLRRNPRAPSTASAPKGEKIFMATNGMRQSLPMTDKPPRIAVEFRSPKNRELFRRIAAIADAEGRSLANQLRIWAKEKVEERERRAGA